MPTHHTDDADLEYWDYRDRRWDLPYASTIAKLEGMAPLGRLRVTLPIAERPASASLLVRVAAGRYDRPDGTVGSYAGTAGAACAASTTNYLYLDAAGNLVVDAAGFPGDGGGAPAAAAHVPLATVDTDATTVTAIVDRRRGFRTAGVGLLPVKGGAFDDAAAVVVLATGATNGVKLGSAAADKLGFWGAAPIARPASANQAALVDSTGGTADGTLADVGAAFSQATLNDNFADVARLVNQLRADLVASGLIKGGP